MCEALLKQQHDDVVCVLRSHNPYALDEAKRMQPSGLARSYKDHFIRRFDQACKDRREEALECWKESKRWTNLMLQRDIGVMSGAADDWAAEHIGTGKYAVKSEWRKFDLMVVSPPVGPEGDWWRSAPRLTLEHENNDDTHVETWNLSCWQSPLKVVVTYHADEGILERKLDIASDVLKSHAAEVGPSSAEFLFMSAPREFGSGPLWSCFEWGSSAWKNIS